MGVPPAGSSANYTRVTVLVLLLLLVIRAAAVVISPLNLGPDEAQYWRWGQDLEWGYYSKPPMIAWVIGATTSLFGESVWAVRIAAPFLHTIAAFLLFLLGRKMFSARVGMFAGLGYALMPGVILSSGIISTDGILLPIYSAGLYALWHLREGAGWRAAAILGIALGLGFLSKYAMIYFGIGLILTCVIDQPTRRAMLSRNGLIALALFALIFGPHVWWNAANGFQTVSHTADNANWGAELLNPENALKFLGDQMGVFGPIGFLALIVGFFAIRGQAGAREYQKERWLLCFILPVLTIIFIQAVVSRAHANWAATAYPAASILVAAWLTRARASKLLWYTIAAITFSVAFVISGVSAPVKALLGGALAGGILLGGVLSKFKPSGLLWAALGIHSVLATLFTAMAIGPVTVSEQLGFANAFKRTRGWEETTATLAEKALEIGATAVMVDERENWHGLDYYGRDGFLVPVYNWRRYNGVKSFSDVRELTAPNDQIVLIASIRRQFRPRIRADFQTFEELGYVEIPLGGSKLRRFKLYKASGFKPLERNEAWEERFEGLAED